ncbi:hypothetical protein GALL_301250 [mine drainage metagenome]|uniref:Uncharacterized protein n=1 Tax=mine drainage metagenome TaxID=410659 RepID=A0A1J5QWB8_9ZZZZ
MLLDEIGDLLLRGFQECLRLGGLRLGGLQLFLAIAQVA